MPTTVDFDPEARRQQTRNSLSGGLNQSEVDAARQLVIFPKSRPRGAERGLRARHNNDFHRSATDTAVVQRSPHKQKEKQGLRSSMSAAIPGAYSVSPGAFEDAKERLLQMSQEDQKQRTHNDIVDGRPGAFNVEADRNDEKERILQKQDHTKMGPGEAADRRINASRILRGGTNPHSPRRNHDEDAVNPDDSKHSYISLGSASNPVNPDTSKHSYESIGNESYASYASKHLDEDELLARRLQAEEEQAIHSPAMDDALSALLDISIQERRDMILAQQMQELESFGRATGDRDHQLARQQLQSQSLQPNTLQAQAHHVVALPSLPALEPSSREQLQSQTYHVSGSHQQAREQLQSQSLQPSMLRSPGGDTRRGEIARVRRPANQSPRPAVNRNSSGGSAASGQFSVGSNGSRTRKAIAIPMPPPLARSQTAATPTTTPPVEMTGMPGLRRAVTLTEVPHATAAATSASAKIVEARTTGHLNSTPLEIPSLTDGKKDTMDQKLFASSSHHRRKEGMLTKLFHKNNKDKPNNKKISLFGSKDKGKTTGVLGVDPLQDYKATDVVGR